VLPTRKDFKSSNYTVSKPGDPTPSPRLLLGLLFLTEGRRRRADRLGDPRHSTTLPESPVSRRQPTQGCANEPKTPSASFHSRMIDCDIGKGERRRTLPPLLDLRFLKTLSFSTSLQMWRHDNTSASPHLATGAFRGLIIGRGRNFHADHDRDPRH
jgi:hypothetical protein